LTALSEPVINHYEVNHGFDHRHGSRKHARIVTTFGLHHVGIASTIDGLLWRHDR
jgi:hypothetical protein